MSWTGDEVSPYRIIKQIEKVWVDRYGSRTRPLQDKIFTFNVHLKTAQKFLQKQRLKGKRRCLESDRLQFVLLG